MAERRMFAKTIIDSDAFLDMPLSSQALYFHLSMRADDDGFNNNPKKVQRMIGASDDDMRVLVAKNFIIPFESGVVVIKHWKIHNYIRKDRIQPTVYQEEKDLISIKDNGSYTMSGICQTTDGQVSDECQHRIGKDSIDKYSIGEVSVGKSKTTKHRNGEFGHVLLTDDEMDKLKEEYGIELRDEAIRYLDEYIEMKGTKYKSHYMALKKWVFDAVKEKKVTRSKKQTEQVSGNVFLDIACDENLF